MYITNYYFFIVIIDIKLFIVKELLQTLYLRGSKNFIKHNKLEKKVELTHCRNSYKIYSKYRRNIMDTHSTPIHDH